MRNPGLIVRLTWACFLISGLAAADTNVSGTISTNTTWGLAGSPYVLASTVIVATGATLTIDPGVVVKCSVSTRRLEVSGTLSAVGTSSSPITFTSGVAIPGPGNWQGLYLRSGSSASRLTYVTVSYGGYGQAGEILVESSSPTFDHVTVTSSYSNGISVTGAGAVLTLSNSTVSGSSQYGLNLTAGAGAGVSSTSFTGNTSYAIGVESGTQLTSFTGVTATGNGSGTKNGINHRGGTLNGSESWTPGLDWWVTGNMIVSTSGTLTVSPGVTARFSSEKRLEVSGTLNATGTGILPILFSSSSATPAPGDWYGISFKPGSSASRLSYVSITYGGYTLNGNVSIEGSSLVLDHVTLASSYKGGINLVTSSSSSTPSIYNGNFSNNVTGGIIGVSGVSVDARLSYWNTASGPSGAGPGTGQSVLSGVTFEPWLTAAPSDPQFFTSVTHLNRTFNPTAGIDSTLLFDTALVGSWTVTIYNSGGTVVRTLTGSTPATAVWDGKNGSGAAQPNGTYRYELASTAAIGAVATVARGSLLIDSTRPLTISGYTASPPCFSPNGDGVQDVTSAAAGFNFDDVAWTVNVKNAAGTIVRSASGSGKAVAWAWNGRDAGGVLQPDGPYTLELSASDGTATATATATTILDVTVPVATIASPTVGQLLSNVHQGGSADVSVLGTGSDANLQSWTLKWGAGSSPTSWTVLLTGASAVTNGPLGTWPTRALANGSYTLRLDVSDQAGNVSAQQVALTVGNLTATQNLLQLNAAGGGTVTYTSIVPFSLSKKIEIKNAVGQVVRTLVNGIGAAGTYNDSWDGRGDLGQVLADGPYFYVITATAGTDSMVWDLTNEYLNDYATRADGLNLQWFDPWNNRPQTVTYSFPQAGRVTIAFAPTTGVYQTCSPPQFCLVVQRYEESGTHTYYWAGVDATGAERGEIQGIAIASDHKNFSKNAVVVYGTKPVLSAVAVGPPVFGPAVGTQTVWFNLSTYQNQPVDMTITFLNQSSLSILRTLHLTGQMPGTVAAVWDGRADNGMLVAPGSYLVTATVTDGLGNQVSGQILTTIQY
jgi:flagellar hook assembly protein FlgD